MMDWDGVKIIGFVGVTIALVIGSALLITRSKNPHEAAQDFGIGFSIGLNAGK